MRITIVQGAFLPVPPLLGGAVEKTHDALGREFVRRGHSVTHISRRFPGLPDAGTVDGVRHRRVSGFNAPRSLPLLKLRDLIYSLRVLRVLPQADVVVTNTFWLPVLLRTRKRGAVYVNVNRYPRGQMRFYQHVARLQAVSQVVGDAVIAQAPGCREKVRVIPNPLPEGWADPGPDLTRPRRRDILYVGRIHPEKGIGLLLEAFRQMGTEGRRDWRLVLVGPADDEMGGGGEAYLASLRRQPEAISDQICWIGPVFDSARLKDFYDRAAVFVYPSIAAHGEAAPLAPLEAMARGCPPIVSDLACFRDYLGPGHNGFVFRHDVPEPATELAKRLLECIGAEDALQTVRRNGVETARRFTPEKIASQLLEDFYRLTSA